jgi:hypothetical protein
MADAAERMLAVVNAPRQLLSCVRWMQARGDPVDDQLWAGIWEIAQTAPSRRTRLMATRMLADRIDPIPRAPVLQFETGPVSLTWQALPSPTPRDPSSNGSTTSSPLDALGPPSSSATDDLASL